MNIYHVALIASVVALGMLMVFNAWALLKSSLNCARAEFVAWCLEQCDKRLTKHAEELDHLAIEYNPDPPSPQKKQVQP